MTDPTSKTISIDLDRIMAAVQADDGQGFCLACGEDQDGFVEPDARCYTCDYCGEDQVIGAEQLLLETVG